jgi:hypothetical protein
MRRREFLAAAVAPAIQAQGGRTIEKNGWRLRVDAAGNIVSLRSGSMELVDPKAEDNRPKVTGPARLQYDVDLLDLEGGAVTLRQNIAVMPAGIARGAVKVEVPRPIRLPFENGRVFLPMKNGVGRRAAAGEGPFLFEFAGAHAAGRPQQLAIPMVDEFSDKTDLHVTCSADPSFLTCFGDSLHWIYPAAVPLAGPERRTVYTCLHRGGFEGAMKAFYATALQEVREGPDWLHDVSMVDYDFLSKNGRGWFADIDVLEKAIALRDRPKVLLALHGWYDFCGRYTYDVKARALDRKWTAFPNALAPEFQKLAERPDNGNAFHWPAASIRAMRPVEMSIEDLHRRIRYAKSRGFRVALYFADGLNACDGIPGFDPAKVLRWGGWTGPETRGRSYALNPLHPEVPEFFKGYLRALLAEYGREVDAFVWDETFYVQAEDLGAGDCRGYAARAMMQLVMDLTAMTGAYGRGLAFLASDDIGLNARYNAPYALVAHGTYQDSACAPKGWPYGLFPNFRNALWSCNWAPMKAFDRTEYAAETFDVPVAISNGYAEDLGVSDMRAGERKRILDLFERRKQRRMEITWIEERDGRLTYRDRPVKEI